MKLNRNLDAMNGRKFKARAARRRKTMGAVAVLTVASAIFVPCAAVIWWVLS